VLVAYRDALSIESMRELECRDLIAVIAGVVIAIEWRRAASSLSLPLPCFDPRRRSQRHDSSSAGRPSFYHASTPLASALHPS
jgi:hypothetical protein